MELCLKNISKKKIPKEKAIDYLTPIRLTWEHDEYRFRHIWNPSNEELVAKGQWGLEELPKPSFLSHLSSTWTWPPKYEINEVDGDLHEKFKFKQTLVKVQKFIDKHIWMC